MEKAVNPEENTQVEIQNENAARESEPAKVNRLFNIVSLALACVLLAAQTFLLIAMGVGIVAADGITINASDITHFIKLLSLAGSEYDIPTIACLAIVATFWLAVLVVTVIGFIKALIGIFKFIKLGEEYDSRETRFGKYVKTVSGSYAAAIALIACSLAFTPSFTAMGTGVVVFGCIIYLASSAVVILFKQVLTAERLNLFELIASMAKKLIMFMLAFLLVANIRESFNVGLGNIFDESVFDGEGKEATAAIYFKIAQPMSLIIVYCCVAAIIVYIMKFYALNNSKKDINVLLKQSFIALLVISLLFCIGDCVVYGMSYEGSTSDYLKLIADGWLGFILVSISGIILTYTVKVEKEEIRA